MGTSTHTKIQLGKTFILQGKVKPAVAGVALKKQRYQGGKWVSFGALTRTKSDGSWLFRIKAPLQPTTLKIRIIAPKYPKSQPLRKVIAVVAPDPNPIATIDQTSGDQTAGTLIMLSGTHSYPGTNMRLSIQRLVDSAWVDMPLNDFTLSRSAWKARVLLPSIPGVYSYTATVTSSRGSAVSQPNVINVVAPVADAIAALGPGNPSRIWGMDVARWQHVVGDPNKNEGVGIDWQMAYDRGIRFAFIKASDGNPVTDARARKWAIDDHAQAQAAGIYTGLYHYPAMPDVSGPANNPAILIADARAEAIQAAARLVEMGGYTALDLPYVLDFESDAIAGSGISDISNSASVTLWTKTWLLEMKARTGRMPILYSGPSFLGAQLDKNDPFWQGITLWIARYTCATNPATGKCEQITHSAAVQRLNDGALPGKYSTPWSTATGMNWTFWQYSSRGVGSEFGIKNGGSVDMNVFNGTTEQFLAFTKDGWGPSVGDYLATLAPVDLRATYEIAEAGAPVTIAVTANRTANGAVAVSGELTVTSGGLAIPGATVSYNGVGAWLVTLPARELGTVWSLQFGFTDPWNFYAANTLDFSIAIPSTP
jgi:GH25 family lysozyme M1 (1,4-beta-N-acetylmuramidase)